MSRFHCVRWGRDCCGQGEARCPPLHEKGHPSASTHSLPFASGIRPKSSQLSFCGFTGWGWIEDYREGKRRVTIRRIWFANLVEKSRWTEKPSASRVDKSSKVKQSSFWRYFQCSLWLVAGLLLPDSVIKDWKCYQPNADRDSRCDSRNGGDLTIEGSRWKSGLCKSHC